MKMLSLYDYLGQAAGTRLGKLVANYAEIRKNIHTELRKISNPRYEGYVVTYPKEFLDEFFATTKLIDNYVVDCLNEAEKAMEEELETINTLLMEDCFKDLEKCDWKYMGM